MKRFVWVSLFISLGVALILLAAKPAAADNPRGFAGSWVGTDIDGSTVRWRIRTGTGSEGEAFILSGTDDFCSFCGAPARQEAVGLLGDPEFLEVSLIGWGLGSSVVAFGPEEGFFIYDPETDTLTDNFGAVYHRSNRNN